MKIFGKLEEQNEKTEEILSDIIDVAITTKREQENALADEKAVRRIELAINLSFTF